MPDVKLISPSDHADVCIDQSVLSGVDYEHPVAKVIAGELHDLVRDYPVFISKNMDTGQFELNALLGFEASSNLYLEKGRWRIETVPLNVARRPFHAVPLDSGAEDTESADFKVGIDMESAAVTRSGGQRLFGEDGQATPFLSTVADMLSRLVEGEEGTRRFLLALSANGLIAPVSLQVTFASKQTINLEGLYSVDRDALASLGSGNVLDFHQKGYLEAIYALLHSVGHLQKLIGWHDARQSEARPDG